ncbi:MAG: hypothetical protein IKR19_07495 [Acholeplasmatales bacterium]|nr:hypothetical protein [Acholeplasmatales bacterium]
MQYTQAKFMREFNETNREQFNPDLFERNDQDTIDAIRAVIQSCERDKYYTIKLLSFEVIDKYEDIYNALRNHEERRKKKNDKLANSYDFINIRDTDMILIKINWLIRHNGVERQEIDGKTIEVVNPEEVMEVLIAVPRFVRKYYFRLAGNYYTTTFQIVDGSTYNNSTASQSKVDTVTMKTTFMPIRIFRSFNNNMIDVKTGEKIKPIEFQSIIFNNIVNVIYYILAAYGLYGTMMFLEINCIQITSEPILDDNYYCFEKNGIYISCPKVCFEDPVVQSLCATIFDGIHKDTTISKIYDQRYWLINLGMAFKNASVDKGLFVLDSIDGIYDNITKQYLHLPMKDKENIYCILRWLIREFSNLRVKDNVDVTTKRIRIADYIAAVYAEKLNKGIHRISDLGTKVTLNKVRQAIYTTPMFIMNNISTMANLVGYRDLVSDYDALIALKYTYKGIAGLGEDGASIQPVYRYVDPSHVGILDLVASSASDPGMSGMICPMAKLYGEDKSFSQFEEPNEWRDKYLPIQNKYNDDIRKVANIKPAATFDKDTDELARYAANRERIVQEELNINRIRPALVSTIDPEHIFFTCSQAQLDKAKNEQPKSLFTIREDNSKEIVSLSDINTKTITYDDIENNDSGLLYLDDPD